MKPFKPPCADQFASETSNHSKGISLRVGGVAAFAAMMALLKYGMAHGASLLDILFYRNAFALPIIAIWILHLGGPSVVRTTRVKAHMLRAILGFAVMCCTFAALARLPLDQATAIGFLAPIFATLLAALLLKEHIYHRQIAVLLLGFLGILIVVQPSGAATDALGLAIALIAALGTAGVSILLRKLGKQEAAVTTVFWFNLSAIAITIIPFMIWHKALSIISLCVLMIAGLLGGVAQMMITASVRYAPLANLSPFDYLQILWAAAWAYFLFSEPVTASTLMGAGLILGAGAITYAGNRNRLT